LVVDSGFPVVVVSLILSVVVDSGLFVEPTSVVDGFSVVVAPDEQFAPILYRHSLQGL
ncbi:hypothetical protein CVS40_0691, partial [Lucilia cuprina]